MTVGAEDAAVGDGLRAMIQYLEGLFPSQQLEERGLDQLAKKAKSRAYLKLHHVIHHGQAIHVTKGQAIRVPRGEEVAEEAEVRFISKRRLGLKQKGLRRS